MLGEALASRFDLSDRVNEDKVGRHTEGRRLTDDLPIVFTVLDPQLKIGQAEVSAVADTSRRLTDLLLSTVLHCTEVGRTEGGNLYLVSEDAEFDSLKARVRSENGLTAEDSLAVTYRLAAILRATSEVGVHHQDLSSSCVRVDFSGETPKVRLAGYGFSRLLPSYTPTRKNEPFHGSAEYMAPEVCSGRPADGAADLYALGILMYEMIAGKPPFVSSSPSTTIKRQVYEKPLPLHLVKPGKPNLEAYEKLVTRLLSKDPKGRPADAGEVMEAILALKTDTFPDVNLDLEMGRESALEVVSQFEESKPEDTSETDASAPEASPDSSETMVFTGLSEQAIKGMSTAGDKEEEDAKAPEPDTDAAAEAASQPTEAFDPSMVKKALKEAADKEEVGTESEEEPATEAPMPEGEKGDSTSAEDWFVDPADQLPESAFPADEEEKKESRMFWVIVGAVAILVGVGAAIYFDGGQPKPPAPPKPVVITPPPTPVEPAPAPVPTPAPAPAPSTTSEVTAPAAVPDPRPPPPTAEELKAEKLASLLADARAAFEADDLEGARKLAEEIITVETMHVEARELVANIDAKVLELKKAEKEKKAEEKKKQRKRWRKAKSEKTPKPAVEKPKPAPKPAPKPKPTASLAETQQKLRGLIRSGRDAYKRGDYTTAIRKYNNALKLDKGNALVRKLLDQAKAKAGQ